MRGGKNNHVYTVTSVRCHLGEDADLLKFPRDSADDDDDDDDYLYAHTRSSGLVLATRRAALYLRSIGRDEAAAPGGRRDGRGSERGSSGGGAAGGKPRRAAEVEVRAAVDGEVKVEEASNVTEALELLCQCIRSLINVKLDPQDLISAKDDIVDDQVKCKLQDTLSILSDYAVRLKGYSVNIMNDNYPSYKLKFAVLQYPALDFYVLRGTRILLIALTWLLATEDVLTLIHRMKFTKSTQVDNLGDILEMKSRESLPISAELDKISQLNGKVNMNLKEISELKREWSKLASKISEASTGYRGRQPAMYQDLPDLRACEMALTKRIALLDGKDSAEDREKLREFNDTQKLLEVHAKWVEIEHVFFDWMATVVLKHKKTLKRYPSEIMTSDLERFTSHLGELIDGRCRYLRKSGQTLLVELQKPILDPPSRLQKCRYNDTEAQEWLNEIDKCVVAEEESLQRRRKRLMIELREMLEQIPSIYRV